MGNERFYAQCAVKQYRVGSSSAEWRMFDCEFVVDKRKLFRKLYYVYVLSHIAAANRSSTFFRGRSSLRQIEHRVHQRIIYNFQQHDQVVFGSACVVVVYLYTQHGVRPNLTTKFFE